MNKKILILFVTLFLFFGLITLAIIQYRSQSTSLTETTPLIPTSVTPQAARPAAEITRSPGIPVQTDLQNVTKQIADEVSLLEKDKIFDSLPLRQENFVTSVGLKTTINIYSFAYDPDSSIRLEIYGLNYNDSTLTGSNAIAFKESFLEAKKKLLAQKVILKNLQIIYGNRQYIQDTATYWVSAFKLLD